MNDHFDDRLDKLFKAARLVKPDITPLETGFEERLQKRMARYKQRESPALSFWSWRMAPVMTVILVVLMVINAVLVPQRSVDILHLLANGYEQGQVKEYLLGE